MTHGNIPQVQEISYFYKISSAREVKATLRALPDSNARTSSDSIFATRFFINETYMYREQLTSERDYDEEQMQGSTCRRSCFNACIRAETAAFDHNSDLIQGNFEI